MAKDFSKMFESSLNFIKEIKRTLSNVFSVFRNKKITVETKVKGAKKVEEVKPSVETLLANQEDLSNANNAQAAKAIGELTKACGDLGIKLDETTGKLTGADSAMIKKAGKDKSRKIRELETELRELEDSNQQQAALRDKAGVPVWFGGNVWRSGKEASEQRALYDAEKRKGGKLTDSEIDATKKLHELSWNMQNLRDQQFGDPSIKTNALRGGFQGAAVVPDSDKYNREISMTNKTMLGVLQRIERLCDKFGKF